jgi:ABC-2 type transport system ATP-binding protein
VPIQVHSPSCLPTSLLRPDGGSARVAGHDVLRSPDAVRRTIGLAGQYAAVDELLTGEENLRLLARLHLMSPADARRRAADLLEQFDLVEAGRRVTRTYSGGMRRRLDLAAALVNRPQVLFLGRADDRRRPAQPPPAGGLLRGLVRDGTTLLLTTQYLEEADQLADDIVVVTGGGSRPEGRPGALKGRLGATRLTLACRRRPDARAAALVLTTWPSTCTSTATAVVLHVADGARRWPRAPPGCTGRDSPRRRSS